MTITNVYIQMGDMSATDNTQGMAQITTNYVARSDDLTDSPGLVLANANIPAIGAAHPTYSYLKVRSRTATRRGKGQDDIFDVTVQYSTQDPNNQDSSKDPSDSPINWPVEEQTRPVRIQIPFDKDRNNTAVLNSAGEPFDPPFTVERVNYVKVYTRNELAVDFDEETKLQLVNSINGADVGAWEAGHVRCNSISYNRRSSNAVDYYAVTYEFEFSEVSWQPSILDQGFKVLEGGNLVRPKDDNDDELPGPFLLDGNGAALPTPVAPADANFEDFVYYQEEDLTTLINELRAAL